MRYGIFSDVHSNLEALEVVLKELRREKLDALVCSGDLVGYGTNPLECLDLLRERGVLLIAGNHDKAVAGTMDLNWFNTTAKAALVWTMEHLPLGERDFLKGLPLVWRDDRIELAHASLHEPDRFHYVLDGSTAELSFRQQTAPAAFIGHTHIPGVFIEEGGRLLFGRTARLEMEGKRRYLVNVGSVGQPRDGDPRACYVVYDSEKRTIETRRVAYPFAKTQAKIRTAGLPELLAERLAFGY